MDFRELRVKDIHSVLRYKPTSTQWTAKVRPNHIIGIQLSGKAVHSFDFGEFTIEENCVYFLNQKDNYTVEVLEPCEAFSIHFTTWDDVETDSFCLPSANPAAVISILEKSEVAGAINHDFELYAHLYRLCAEVERIRDKVYYPKDPRIMKAKDYMDLNFKEKDCLSQAIAQSKMSSRHFGALFQNAFDTAPSRYLILKKIAYAKTLLSVGNLSVAEVASLCNFSDVYYFSKVFKSETGISPSKWKG